MSTLAVTYVNATTFIPVVAIFVVATTFFVMAIGRHEKRIDQLEGERALLIEEASKLTRARDVARSALGGAHKKIDAMEAGLEAMVEEGWIVRVQPQGYAHKYIVCEVRPADGLPYFASEPIDDATGDTPLNALSAAMLFKLARSGRFAQ